jgi:hypothetical protein
MKIFFTAAFLCSAFHGFPQWPATNYPKGYFRDPLAIPMSLAANFGELRPDHYHMGLDIRTQHRENLPVFAAADGHVSRVSVGPFGFGQAIYIDHPNGYTTVYGHLNRFFPALAAYVAGEQYRRQSWQVDLQVPPGLFLVRKGEIIAYSGNTGGSQGPHLHFEIRRTDGDINLNPLLFGLPVADNTAPTILRLAWYDRNQGIYEQSPHILPVRKGGTGLWTIAPALLTVPSTRISLALSAFDTQTGSTNPNGIFEGDLFIDGLPVIGFQLNNISYDNTRNINAHIDYKTRGQGGPFLQQLFFLRGYPAPSIYRSWGEGDSGGAGHDPAGQTHAATGVIDLGDGRAHGVRIEVKDAYGNSSSLSFRVQYRPPAGGVKPEVGGRRDTLAIDDKRDSITVPLSEISTKKFYPGMVDGIEIRQGAFYLTERSLYDSVSLSIAMLDDPRSGYSLRGGVSEVFRIGDPWIPLLEPVMVRLRLTSPAVDAQTSDKLTPSTDKIVMVCFDIKGKIEDVERPEWKGAWASARFREFGNYQLVEDRTAPVITPLQPMDSTVPLRTGRIAFSVKDDLGAVRNFRAELDGAWLCFSNDKGAAYIYNFDGHCPRGRHTLKVSAEDVAGNRTVKEYHFIR